MLNNIFQPHFRVRLFIIPSVTDTMGEAVSYAYDTAGRVTETAARTAVGSLITGFAYTYDELSRIISEKHLAKGVQMWYTYDNLWGVTKRSKKTLSGEVLSEESFAYDDAGNLIGDHSENLFEYCTGNRLSAYNGQPISYDRDGQRDLL